MRNTVTSRFQSLVFWLRRQPVYQRLCRRYPRLIAFVENRFSTKRLAGLPLTLLIAVYLVNVSLLSQLAEDVVESEGIVTVDEYFTRLLYNIRSTWFSQTLYFLTHLGTREATFIVGGIMSSIFLFRRRYAAIFAFWLTMAGVGLSVQYGKKYISRDRPEEVGYYIAHNFSFPSGHATTSVALYGLAAYFLCSHYRARWQQRLVLWSAVALVVVVGFSRIYLGVHFLSDVLAGYLLGVMWLLLGISLVEILKRRRKYSN